MYSKKIMTVPFKHVPLSPHFAQPGSEGATFPIVCYSGEAATGEAGVGGTHKAEAGRRAGEGEHILPFVSFTVLETAHI